MLTAYRQEEKLEGKIVPVFVMLTAYREEEKLEGEDVPILAVAGCNLPELTPCLKCLLDALLDIAVNLVSEGRLQVELPAVAKQVNQQLGAVFMVRIQQLGASVSSALCPRLGKAWNAGLLGNSSGATT